MKDMIYFLKNMWSAENKKTSLWLFAIIFILIASMGLYDAAAGGVLTLKTKFIAHILDQILGLLMYAYSLVFAHKYLASDEEKFILPTLKSLFVKENFGVFKFLFIVAAWLFYGLILGVILGVYHGLTKDVVLPILVLITACLICTSSNYLYIEFAREYKCSKPLFNPMTLIKIYRVAFLPTVKKIAIFMLLLIASITPPMIINRLIFLAAQDGIIPSLSLGNGVTAYGLIFASIICFMTLALSLAFLYSLLGIYNEKVRPLFEEKQG